MEELGITTDWKRTEERAVDEVRRRVRERVDEWERAREAIVQLAQRGGGHER